MPIPQTIFRPYRVVERLPLAAGMFRLVVEAESTVEPLPPFQAGQWVNMRLLHADGSEWAKAAYSIASAPSDGTQRLEFGIKVAGDFTKRVRALSIGDRVELQGPWGLFIARPGVHSVFLAGGIGVTPFVSMMREAAASSVDAHVTLMYSNRTIDEAPYLDELQKIAGAHPNIRVIATCTRDCPEGWAGERGRIDAAMLRRAAPEEDDADYFLCGPDDFMQSMRALLLARGIGAKRIKQESFG